MHTYSLPIVMSINSFINDFNQRNGNEHAYAGILNMTIWGEHSTRALPYGLTAGNTSLALSCNQSYSKLLSFMVKCRA